MGRWHLGPAVLIAGGEAVIGPAVQVGVVAEHPPEDVVPAVIRELDRGLTGKLATGVPIQVLYRGITLPVEGDACEREIRLRLAALGTCGGNAHHDVMHAPLRG